MTHTYQITGMTCSGCEDKVKRSLLLLPEVSAVEVSKDTDMAIISMEKHIALEGLQMALGGKESKYQISANQHIEFNEEAKSFWQTYKPVLLLFTYLFGFSLIASWHNQTIDWMRFMRFFMSGFFLSFSYFKLINLKAFSESYAMYDVIAKKFKPWGYVYAFIELGLGIAFAINYSPVLINLITLIVMSISIVGVVESVINRRKIQCACLGAVFNLPMSTITIIEDLLMIIMSLIMLIIL